MSQRGFAILKIILIVIGIAILGYAIYVGSLFLRFQRDVKLMDEKNKGYEVYMKSLKSATPSATTK